MAAGRDVYTELRIICVWVKHNAGMGSFHRIEEAEVAKLQWQPKIQTRPSAASVSPGLTY